MMRYILSSYRCGLTRSYLCNKKLVVEGNEVLLSEGDVALILPNEKYFWEGTMTLFTTATPAWTMEQHRQIP